MVKHLPAMRETRVWSLGQEDPLEKQTATHSSTLAWKIPWTEEPGMSQSLGVEESDTTEQLHFHFHPPQEALVVKNLPANAGVIRNAGSIPGWGRYPGEGHGNPLQ